LMLWRTAVGTPALGLRYGEIGEWVFVVKYGGWPGAFFRQPPVSRGDAHVFQLEFEEENGKPVPPQFSYLHDDRLMFLQSAPGPFMGIRRRDR
jgi:hypothetical protein